MSNDMNSIFILYFVLLVSICSQICVNGAPQVPCYFIFGDSLADNGNNNGLDTQAKVNFPPYGVDYPGGPTGRFTNGKTEFDIIGELLGFPAPIPPFATAAGKDILQGVNYASGSSGIRDESGKNLGTHISMNQQIANHEATIGRIVELLGNKEAADQHLNKCLYTISMGSNDYINNYCMPDVYPTSKQNTPQQYASLLANQFSEQLQKLHTLGAKKIAIAGLGYIGCTPNAIKTHGTGGAPCVDTINAAVTLFNTQLVALVDQLNAKMTDSKFTYLNASSAIPLNGFKVLNQPCCESGPTGTCVPNGGPVCPNRAEYLFWDAFHPTEAVNKITAPRSYKAANPADAHPWDISTLLLPR